MESVHDAVPSQSGQPISVGSPGNGRTGGDTPIVVEVYALGRGVSVAGQGGDLAGRQGTFELEANGKVFVFDPLSAGHSHRFVTPVQGDIAAIGLPVEAVDQENLAELRPSFCHSGTPCKTAILNLPAGMGKTLIAHSLAQRLGCSHVVEEWNGQYIRPGALHLTNGVAA